MPKTMPPKITRAQQRIEREKRRLEIIDLMKQGMFQHEIAAKLQISPQRVNQYVTRQQFREYCQNEAAANAKKK